MKYLLDTHVFLWWSDDNRQLSKRARELISKKECFVSVASVWEMAIKVSIGKLRLASSVSTFVERHLDGAGFELLPLRREHAAEVEFLPHHRGDPFDRLLVAQGKFEELTLISADAVFDEYEVERVW